MKHRSSILFNLFLSVLVLISICLLEPAHAHIRSESFSSWNFNDDEIEVSYTIKTRNVIPIVTILSKGNIHPLQGLVNHVTDNIILQADNNRCNQVNSPEILISKNDEYIHITWRFDCRSKTKFAIHINAMFDLLAGHTHFAKLKRNNQLETERLITEADRTWNFTLLNTVPYSSNSDPSGSTLSEYFKLGTKHILSGYDHLAFLLAIILLIGWQPGYIGLLFISITGFTIGHSITLALTVLGIVKPEVKVVEALIGYTIALVAVETIAKYTSLYLYLGRIVTGITAVFVLMAFSANQPPLYISLFGLTIFCFSHFTLVAKFSDKNVIPYAILTMLFGSIHGFGFAGSLLEIGLPNERLIPALLGFNLGVECGQLALIMLILGIIVLGKFVDIQKVRRYLPPVTSSALCGLGLYWFVLRAFA